MVCRVADLAFQHSVCGDRPGSVCTVANRPALALRTGCIAMSNAPLWHAMEGLDEFWSLHHFPLVTRVHSRVLERIPAGDKVLIGNSVSRTDSGG